MDLDRILNQHGDVFGEISLRFEAGEEIPEIVKDDYNGLMKRLGGLIPMLYCIEQYIERFYS